ncbi:MAG TPA: hypothetical protein VG865_05240, partial [Casimicrobiaceae bacterium]|nr:hypothetical protein [Casimicrobiaceae bacterium]
MITGRCGTARANGSFAGSIASAAARETLEEAAWRVDPTALVGVYHWQSPLYGTYVRFAFAAKPRRHEPA